ncbi:hemagglutinin repeat-containing protein [Candidatus Tisiphia endosymbiont of Oplodontha viridula]|uniref:hemagglutinin repeat-containing protein n=1 Tax=Candidatus Tisiphia endosymbiont of Oplodontha viridula TaxID=3077925 RepID=UPI0035C91B6E
MFDFYVSSDKAVLELHNEDIDYVRIYNDLMNPTDTIYCILPWSQDNKPLYWHSTTTLTGPSADLVILTQNLNRSNLSVENADFRQFRSITVSDNKFHRDGDRFLVIQQDEHNNNTVIFRNCQALSADFFCNKLTWIGGRVKNNLSVELHGSSSELTIKGSDEARAVIGTLIIPENIRPLRVCLENVAIITNFSCENVKTLSLRDVKSGSGICKLIAEEIEELSNFQNLSTQFIVKAEIANFGSFISPIGKVYIDVCSFIEFRADGDGRFQGLDLNIDVSRAIEKKIEMPYGIVRFDKINIKGASIIDIPGILIAEQVEIINCLQLNLNESRIGHLKYQTPQGQVFFGKHSAKTTTIDSLWLIGNIVANFQGSTELFDLDSEGRSHIAIFSDYKGKFIKLNLNLDGRRDNISSDRDGYFGLHIQNAGNKKVEIEAILAKLNSFNISGSVKLGQVICQPIDSKYNLIQINVQYLSHISIDGFFAGFDHNIVIEKATGKISLVQSMDRALSTGQIIAGINCAMQDFLTIRAGQGLSFHGNIKVIDGNIELYSLFGVLSARGSLTAKQIKLLAIGGILDISAHLNTHSLVTYSKTDSYIHDTIINAIQFLAHTVGHYIQIGSNVTTSKTVIVSENGDIMLKASVMQSVLLEMTSGRDIGVDKSNLQATDQSHRSDNIYIADSNISGQTGSFQSRQDIGIVRSRIIEQRVTNQAGQDLMVVASNVTSHQMGNVAGRDIAVSDSQVSSSLLEVVSGRDVGVDKSNIRATDQSYRADNVYVTDTDISGQASSFESRIDVRVDKSKLQATDQSYRGDNIYVTDSNISGKASSFQSCQDIGIVRSNIIEQQVTNQAGQDLRIEQSNIACHQMENVAGRNIGVDKSKLQATDQSYRGDNIYVTDSNISGQTSSFESRKDIGIVKSNIIEQQVTNQAGQDLRIEQSNIACHQMENVAGRDIGVDKSNVIGKQVTNQAGQDLRIVNSNITNHQMVNVVGRDMLVSDSSIISRLLVNYSEGNTTFSNSEVFTSQMFTDAQNNITIDGSKILAENNLFFRSIANYLAINSDISLSQLPTNLFLYNSSARDSNGNLLVRCGFPFKEIEALGLVDARGHVDKSFSELQYHLVNSSKIDLSIFQAIAEENPQSIIIDAHTGAIIGSRLSAKDHQVIIKTKNGLELLPLSLYNATMFSGGFNDVGIQSVISKIEAGAIDIDAGSYLKSVGALLRANSGSLKADYIMNQSFIKESAARHASLQALKPWLSTPELYDMIVNDQIVPTRLEFSEITKIDLGKGKIDLFYPYSSKRVDLRQSEGDVNIDRDVHFPYEVMAVHVDSGKIFFSTPKVEQYFIRKFSLFTSKTKMYERHVTDHVHITGENLFFDASGDIEVHGKIEASGELGLKSGGEIKLVADKIVEKKTFKWKSFFGRERVINFKEPVIKQSVLRAENAYMMANNIEVVGSLITIKDHLQIVSQNNIKVLPIALITSYCHHAGKATTSEKAIKHVVSEINAGILNIDAGKAVEFISTLIEAEEMNLHAKDLKIGHAKDIFDKQVEFKGKKKWHGGRNSWSSHDHTETVLPTVINAGSQRFVIDQDATIEAAKIIAEQDILMEVGGNLTVKDGYNLHIHDYHKKSYSLWSSDGGSMTFNSNKNVKKFNEEYDSVPTIICAGGSFYGIVGGQMHILGSKIMGQDIHLVVPNGLKLEASKYTDKSLIFCSESGFKVGFYHKGKSEGGFRIGATTDRDQEKLWEQHLNSSELVASNTLTIMAKDGTFEQISSDISAKIIQVEARNWQAKTYDAETISKHIEQHAELGVKLAVKQNVTNVIDKVKMLVTKKGSHVIDNLDRVFKAYDAYKSLAMLPTNAVNVCLYAYLSASQSEEMTHSTVSVDNIINGETIIAHVKDDIRFQGVKMTAKDVDFAATNFTFETSSDKYNYQYDFSSIDLEIDLDTGDNSSFSASTQNAELTSTTHHHNYIKASGNLKITLSGDGKFKGVSLEGVKVDIKANNLIVESVQDIVSERLSGANINIGFNKEYNFTGFGGGVEAGFKEKAWTSQVARIIGSQLVNIVVKETLEIAGGLIANGEEDKNGKLTDKGNLSINCGRMVVKTIHDYDQGLTLGIGANFQVKNTEKPNGKNEQEVTFHHAPVKVQFKDHQQVVTSTIGKGQITSGSISGDQLNRDISQHKEITKEEEASFDSVVHGDMLKTVLGIKESVKRSPDITKIPKDELSKTLPKTIVHYFSGLFDNFKQAAKDVIIKGAKTANIFGAEIDTKQLGKNLEKGNDWHFGSKLSPAEIQEFEKQLAENYQKLKESGKDGEDGGEDEQVTKNKLQYFGFFQNLEEEIAKAEASGSSKADLQAMLHISQVFYKKEQSDAAKEGRPIKDFGEFAKHLNQHIYNNSIFAGKVHDNIVKILLKTQLVVEQKYAIIGGGDGAKDSKGVISKSDQGRKEQQVAGMRDHTELPTHPEHSEKSIQTKDELDVKLHEIIRTNPEITQKIEENGGYDKLKRQLVEIAKELFGISEAQAAPVAALGMAGGLTEGTAVAGTALGGTAALTAIMNAPKDALVTWLFENIGDEPSGQILKIALTLAAEPESVMNIIKPQPQSEFEKRKHDDNSNKPSTSKQQQKMPASTTFMPDPGDLDPDDDENKDEEQNSFDPSKEGNYDKIRRDARYGKLYRDANNDKIWYSKEISGDRAHAGEHWKQFIKKGGELIHEADIDLTGKVIDKWKSKTGAVIKFKDTIGIK